MNSSGLNFYHLIGKSLLSVCIFLTLISCSNYRYITQNYNATIIIDSLQAAEWDTGYEIEKDSNGIHIVQTYSKDSILISIERYKDYKNWIKSGESSYWFPDGKIKKIEFYNDNNKLDGSLITYHNNSQIKRKDFYKSDSLISGKCYDSLGNEIKYFKYIERTIIDMQIFQNCLKYPENLRRQNIEERVKLLILLDKKGKIIKIKYDELNSMEFVNVASRCILNYNLNPVKVDGEPIICWLSIPVTFMIR